MNIVVPMAGKSSGFLRSKFKYPRYGVEINGISILKRSLRGLGDAKYHFVCFGDHFHRFNLNSLITSSAPQCSDLKMLLASSVTHGQASTALWADKYVRNDDPLLIISPLQIIEWDPQKFLAFCENSNADAATVATDWLLTDSEMFFSKVDEGRGLLTAVSETYHDDWYFDCGVYYFKYGWYFSQWAREMMERSALVGGEYWVAPVMNYGVAQGKKVRPYLVDSAAILKRADDVRKFAKRFPDWARP